MNKKMARKYLEIVSEDSGLYIDRNPRYASAPHICNAKKRPCPKKGAGDMMQTEFDFAPKDPVKEKAYRNYLSDFRSWAMRQTNHEVLSDAFRKYEDNPDISKILSEAADALYRRNARSYLRGFGERL